MGLKEDLPSSAFEVLLLGSDRWRIWTYIVANYGATVHYPEA